MLQKNISVSETELSLLCKKHGIRELSVFGSALGNMFTEECDIVLLVDFNPEKTIGLIEFFSIRREFEKIFGRKVDLVSKGGVTHPRKSHILRDAKSIYAQ